MKQEIETVAEEVDKVVDNVQHAVKNPWAVPVAAGISLVVGLGVGFLLGRRTIKETVEIVEIERSELKEDSLDAIKSEWEAFKARRTTDKTEDLLREERAIQEVVRQENRPDPADIEVDTVAIEHTEKIVIAGGTLAIDPKNVFASESVDEWDYEEELKHRSEDAPYVIHKDEFWNEEKGYDQTSLCYYAGDDILADQEDHPIYGYQSIIGHQMRFGHGSSDPNVFYVRNDNRMCEYEILLHDGTYAASILGVQAEEAVDGEEDLKHSLRKFKRE